MNIKKIILSILLAIIIMFLIAIMGHERPNNTSKKTDNNKIQVVVSNFASYDFIRAIIGDTDQIQLSFLLGPGKEAHSYEPTSQDLIKMQRADLFVYIGKDLEPWAEKVVELLDKSNTKVICLSENIELSEEKRVDGAEENINTENNQQIQGVTELETNNLENVNETGSMLEGEQHQHTNGVFDEHIWTSPTKAIKMVELLEKSIEEMDNQNIEKYRENAQNYILQIQKVKKEIQEVVDNSVRNRLVFGDKMPMQYFIEEYNLEVSAAFNGCSIETDPNSRTIAYLVDTVKKENIQVILYCELGLGKIAKIIAQEAQNGAEAMQIQTLHNISKTDFENGETWVTLMTRNIEVLKKALQ